LLTDLVRGAVAAADAAVRWVAREVDAVVAAAGFAGRTGNLPFIRLAAVVDAHHALGTRLVLRRAAKHRLGSRAAGDHGPDDERQDKRAQELGLPRKRGGLSREKV
jgi:hypothetical protein